MARRGFHPFARIGEAFKEFWRSIAETESERQERAEERRIRESIERARRPLPPRPFGVPEPPRREREPVEDVVRRAMGKAPPLPEPEREGPDLTDHGPYPPHWGQAERDFWDSEPQTFREFYDEIEWRDLQEAFDRGWIERGMSKEEHEEWRDRFYLIAGIIPASFDWEAYREYLRATGSPAVR